jgi:hypothetical protein
VILRNNLKKEYYRQEENGLALALEILKSNVEIIMKKFSSSCCKVTHAYIHT